jgi:hypothetical protein
VISIAIYFILDIIAASVPPVLPRRFAICIALGQSNKNRAAQLCSYWKQMFFTNTSAILSLRSAPQENR